MKLILLAFIIMQTACSNCDDALVDLSGKFDSIKVADKAIPQPLTSTYEFQVAKGYCDSSRLEDFTLALIWE